MAAKYLAFIRDPSHLPTVITEIIYEYGALTMEEKIYDLFKKHPNGIQVALDNHDVVIMSNSRNFATSRLAAEAAEFFMALSDSNNDIPIKLDDINPNKHSMLLHAKIGGIGYRIFRSVMIEWMDQWL